MWVDRSPPLCDTVQSVASRVRRLDSNVAGDFYVDDSCIDCGACRWIAPNTYDGLGDFARVYAQPKDAAEVRAALQALTACPTSSIGTVSKHDMKPIVASFPRPIDEAAGVYHCGFHHADSFGAASYLIVREGGNILVDSPRFTRPLVRAIERLGGIELMFLTHRDDVADHARFADHFGCERVLHHRDAVRSTREVERKLRGQEPIRLDDEVTFIPVTGHTEGSVCLLYRERFLFSGDHVAYDLEEDRVYAFRGACWFSWSKQIVSMERLAGHRFEHILPGHGAPCCFPAEEMREQLELCIEWMREV
jgi:glyoxylase-like metal-dependent hydrolase (beta-lactamase superfamily II)/ferredoxin